MKILENSRVLFARASAGLCIVYGVGGFYWAHQNYRTAGCPVHSICDLCHIKMHFVVWCVQFSEKAD